MEKEYSIIQLIPYIISFVLLTFNIIQFVFYRKYRKLLKTSTKSSFLDFFLIAQSCTRLRDLNKKLSVEKMKEELLKELYYIRGISDSSRNKIIAISREYLGVTPKFEHPAFPEKKLTNEEILGKYPEDIIQLVKEESIDKQTVDNKSVAG